MVSLVFAVDPILAGAGQIAAFLICLLLFVFVVIILALNLVLSFGMAWLREKVNFIKMLRPYVESINKEASTATSTGHAPTDAENPIARAIGTLPVELSSIEKKVEQASDRVVNASIEFRARTEQAKAIVQTLLRPRTATTPQTVAVAQVDQEGLQFQSPGYRALMEDRPEVIPGQSPASEIPQRQVTRTRR